MNKQTITIVTLLILTVLGCKSAPTDQAAVNIADATQPVSILRDYHGVDDAFCTVGVQVIDSAAALEESGSTQLCNLEADFDNEIIVVLALGEQPSGGYWTNITAMQIGETGGLYVQGIANRPAENGAVTLATTYPIHAAVISKIDITSVHPEIDSVVGQSYE